MSAVTDKSIMMRIEIRSLDLGNVKFIVDLDENSLNRVLRMKARIE